MKRASAIALLSFLFLTGARASGLRVDIVPQFNGAPLTYDAMTNRIASGQKVSITRLDFLISNVGLHQKNGDWIENGKSFAFIDARDGRTNFVLADVPPGEYDRVRFQIGLPPEINHGDITRWPPNHPLNPDVDHLYWSWSKEYIFLALEGSWQNGGKQSGFSYHVATDRQLTTIDLAAALDLKSSREMQIAFDVEKVFSGPHKIQLADSTDTSHSRTNDLLAVQLHENLQNAFTAGAIVDFFPVAELIAGTNHVVMASTATPYRFSYSAFAPQPDLPRDNPLTVEGVALGSKLFFDPRLSGNNTESCATCHRPGAAFSQPRRFSRGADGDIGTRNAMALENLAWKNSFFWDGRAKSVREQVLQPIQNPIEMHATLSNVVAKIAADKDYPRLFKNAFGSTEITSDRIARALEQFLLVQTSFNSKFDRVAEGLEKFTDEEARGFVLFNTEYDPYHGQYGADCFHCHGGPLFQSQNFGNNGLDSEFKDLGLYQTTHRAGDEGKFAVPSLRNVAVTSPYMHDGRFQTLDEVIEHYSTGMKRSATLDPNLAKHPDGGVPLSAADKKALIAFLRTLTDEKFLSPAVSRGLAQK